MRYLRTWTIAVGAMLVALPALAQPTTTDTGPSAPRQVILIIGDGMDDQQITIARNYLTGARGHLVLDTMPVRSAAQILTVEDNTSAVPVYVADSANTATSMATGAVTSRGRIATTAGSDKPIPTIVEAARAAGLRTGIVSTASVTDATPASFASHINLRLCENPSLMAEVTYRDIYLGSCKQYLKSAGGPGSIAEQLATAGLDVLLGGGSKHFAVQAEGSNKTVAELAADHGYQLLSSPEDLAAANTDQPILGLFSASTMPVRLQGENERSAEAPSPSLLNHVHRYLGEVELPAPMVCEPNPAAATVPSLKQMTEAALAHLSRDNAHGFFLMVESASIDKQAHERKPCGSIGELQQLDEALQAALAFADEHANTLVLVTADHAQAAQLIPNVSLFAAYPIPTYTPGMLARIRTPEGGYMAVNYATTNFQMEEHTGANVPLYANGEGRGRVKAYVQQPDIYAIMADYLGLDKNATD